MAFLLVLAVVLVFLTSSAAAYQSPAVNEQVTSSFDDSNQVTAITSGDTPNVPGYLIAVDNNGRVIYKKTEHRAYWDVDPVPGTDATVLYTASRDVEECEAATACRENVVEIANISTGETRRVFSRTYAYHPLHKIGQMHTVQWHDVDRDGNRLYVADMATDRVLAINLNSSTTDWVWNPRETYPLSGGGPYPYDWTHVNDVEVLEDGRIMVSLRNQDQVVFLNQQGRIESLTLGSEDDYSTLHHQHNPDYIPASRGGPAVLVGDSTNNRIVEYQRVEGQWVETWVWRDASTQWPRDADRLPNGHTLITDSAGDRVIEVDRQGTVVWQRKVTMPYEAERLGTGDESSGGDSARSLNLSSQNVEASQGASSQSRSTISVVEQTVLSLIPTKVIHGIDWALPNWMGMWEVGAAGGGILLSVVWVIVELRWSSIGVNIQVTGRE